MAEKRKEPKIYNAEEQAEISRIIAKLPGSPGVDRAVTPPPPPPEPVVAEEPDFLSSSPDDGYNLDSLPDELGSETNPDIAFMDEISSFEDNADNTMQQDGSEADFDEQPQDITSLLEELPEQNDETSEIESLDDFSQMEDLTSEEPSDLDMSSIDMDEPTAPRFSYTPKSVPRKDPTLAQLDSILGNEPETIDAQDYSKDIFYQDDEPEQTPLTAPAAEDMADMATLPDISPDEGDFASSSIEDIPDLSSLSIEEPHTMESASIDDLPDLDVADFALETPEKADSTSIADELDDFDISSADLGDDELSADSLDIDELSPQADISDNDENSASPDIDVLPDIDDSLPEIEIEPDDGNDYDTPSGAAAGRNAQSEADLSADDIRKMKKALLLYAPGLTEVIKDTILNDRLSPGDTQRLVELIVNGRPENNVHRFLEKKLSRKIDPQGGGHRRVLIARPEYSQEGRERQRRLLNLTRLGIAGTLALTALIVLGWHYIYKPYMAARKIEEGVRLIRRDADPKFPDYKKAEEIFAYVEKHYVKDYIPGYNRYGRAYFDKKEYMRSLEKLNKAYLLAQKDKFYSDKSFDTLLELGYFYSRKKTAEFDKFFDESVKLNLNEYYFQKIPPIVEIKTQYDLAYNFYRMVLNKRPKSIDALLGIGNIYMNQGEYLKAREYYEEILKVDKNSVAGHAGLLNLFIERDEFTEALTIYVKLRDRKSLKSLPSPLLAKFSNYLLGKTKSDKTNIRIDYGIQSPRLKDNDDQPFPAVVEVLKALREKDPDYPPLYVQYAKLSIKQKNYMLAKQYLENGLERSKKQKYTFFAGNQMLGEFYYYMKKADLAYRYLKQAAMDYATPPAYTFEDFYYETEHPGRTPAMLGNIFYYFFDQVTFRTGDQESQSDVEMRANADKMANYNIARNYYEQAIDLGYNSNEVHYNLGRVYYLNSEYSRALDQWLNLYDSFIDSPELMMGLGNVFYKLENYDSAKAQFMKLIAVYEFEAEKVKTVVAGNGNHTKMFKTLSSAYNNLGAVYQIQNQTEQGIVSFWNSIKYAQRLNQENEFARTNVNRDFKDRTDETKPILDDNIPYSIEYFMEDMRSQ